MSTFYGGGGETKLPMQELELKMQGGGRNCGILWYIYFCWIKFAKPNCLVYHYYMPGDH